ncbi:hypothetical protein M9H77_10808 [Catharanthus roseus]|uniref:Uncharacterized protein n=1 Tax=Catharanthus roseus TaxID=4058 RepID=A0ACC0BCQ1_CATRO|nr:hypothetical protein M9H77_10808 [Catharanthus roseus]
MGEALLGLVTESVFNKALSMATEQVTSVLTVQDNLETLAEDLQLIQALLADAEYKSSSSGLVHLWLAKLKKAAADADILLDEFAYEILRKKIQKGNKEKVRSFFSSSNPLIFHCRMANDIKNINLRLETIFQKSTRIGLRPAEIVNYPAVERKRVTLSDPFLDHSQFVGRAEDRSKIVNQLISSNGEKGLSVLGIVGMAGQGKTTIAKLIFGDDQVKEHFEKRIWTCVSEDFSVEKIIKDMLQSCNASAESKTTASMVSDLKKEIGGKRFLLVLDDVWNEDFRPWENMKNCLQEIGGAKGSWILMTTRNESVVSVMKGSVHRLGGLSKEESEELFEKIAFGNDRGAAEKTFELVEIGKRIAGKCRGVPLAVKAIASLMSSYGRDELKWKKIEESNLWNDESAGEVVLSSIRLSFDHLPSLSLKQCFAFCSVFPKDWDLERTMIIRLWMANGLLHPSRGSKLEMEDVGNNYLETLLRRSLLQEAEFDMFGNIKSCKMHDLVHDFALEASQDWCSTVEAGSSQSEHIEAIHLSIIYRGSASQDISIKSLSRLRTLIFYGRPSLDLHVLGNCKRLSVLVLDYFIEDLPKFIVRLKHLRYLDISGTSIVKLPNSITKLYNLQTLRLVKLTELPRDYVNLVKLRHLDVEFVDDYTLVFHGLRKLTSLRTLPYFVVSQDSSNNGRRPCKIEELGVLQNLEGKLKILGLENVKNREEAMKADLSSKRNIQNIELDWGTGVGDRMVIEGCHYEDVLEGLKPPPYLKSLKITNFGGENLPSWMMMISSSSSTSSTSVTAAQSVVLHNLVSIDFSWAPRCQQIPPLWHLPFLKDFRIWHMDNLKCIDSEFYGFSSNGDHHHVAFPSLKNLHLERMEKLEQWYDPPPPSEKTLQLFPVLEYIYIDFAPQLTNLPNFLTRIASLKSLHIKGLASISRLSEDLGKLTSLEILQIESCENLVYIPSMKNLPSLKELFIKGLASIGQLPEDLEKLTSLETLRIENCKNLVYIPSVKGLRSLRYCYFFECPKLKSLPEGFDEELCTQLKEFATFDCPNLKIDPHIQTILSRPMLLQPSYSEPPSYSGPCDFD